MLRFLAIASCIALVSSQQILCKSQTYPSIAGICPNEYTIITSGECCLSTDCYTAAAACADKLNSKGENECPGVANYCNNSLFKNVMKEQCSKTCKFC